MKININGSIVEINDDELNKAIEDKAESIEIKSEELEVRSKADFDTYIGNLKSESQKIGEEIGRKELFKSLEIESEGTGAHKDVNKSKDLIQNWSNGLTSKALEDAKIEPDKKVQELTNDLNTMRSNFENEKTRADKAESNFTEFKTNIEKTNLIRKALPDNLALPEEDVMLIINQRVNIGKNENGSFVGLNQDGSVMKNSNLEPLSVKEVLSPFFENNPHLLTKPSGGAGGGDSSGGSSKQSIEDFTKEMREQGFAPNSPKFNEIMQSRMKEGKLEL